MHPQNLGGRGSEQTLFQLCNQLTAHGVIGLVAKSVQLFGTLCTVVHQAPLSVGFSRQEYWSGLPCPPPGDLPDLGIEPRSPALQVDSLLTEPPGKPAHDVRLLRLSCCC